MRIFNKLSKKSKVILAIVLFSLITGISVYAASNIKQSFDTRSSASSVNNRCSLPAEQQSTLAEYAQARGINVGTLVSECFSTTNTQQDLCKQTVIKEYQNMMLQFQTTWRWEERTRGTYNYKSFDEMVEFAKSNNLKLHYFHLIWQNADETSSRYSPEWLFPNKNDCGNWTRAELLRIMKDRIQNTIARGGDTVVAWNVVNEMFARGDQNNCYYKIIGPDYIDKAFQYAREATPDGLLVLNETFGAERIDKDKVDSLFEYIKDAKSRGIPIDAVGLQNHLRATTGKQFDQEYLDNLAYFLQKAKNSKVKVMITEMDIYQANRSQSDVAKLYKDVMSMCLNDANCISFGTWGISDKESWLRNDRIALPDARPLLFDENYKKKQSYFSIMEALKENSSRECRIIPEEITYASRSGENQTLFICKPLDNSRKYPAVLFIHGGGFVGGDKSSGIDNYCNFFAKNNIVYVSVNYRLSSTALYPAAYDDVQYAMRWLRSNADKYNIDSDQIASMGISAGATLASYLGVVDTHDQTLGLNDYSSKSNLVISLYGAQDFNKTLGTWKPTWYFHNNSQEITQGSPVTHLTKDDVPFLIFHGTSDTTIPISQSQFMVKELNALNIENKFITFDGNHAVPAEKNELFKSEMLTFLNKYFEIESSPNPEEPTDSNKVNTTFWDSFKGGTLNVKRWGTYQSNRDIQITESPSNNLKIIIPQSNTFESAGVMFKTQIPSDSDFRIHANMAKPSLQGSGTGVTGISFDDSTDGSYIKLFWSVQNGVNNLILTTKDSTGKTTQHASVNIGSEDLLLKLRRDGSSYTASYQIAGDDDNKTVTIGQVDDSTLITTGKVKIFSNNQGLNDKYPGVTTNIKSISVSWFDKSLSEIESLYETFSGRKINNSNWYVNAPEGTKASIDYLGNLSLTVNKGSNNNSARVVAISSKDFIPAGRDFNSTTIMLKPTLTESGVGRVAYKFVSNDSCEEASIVWSVSDTVSQLIFSVLDENGREVTNKTIKLDDKVKKVQLMIKRDKDGYWGYYKDNIDTDVSYNNFNDSGVPVDSGSDGKIRLSVNNVGASNRYPFVRGKFDKVTLTYYK